ncbi:DNA-binding response regulator [Thomasclavelia cocleata]|uniref:Two-component system, OmpR family, response regulator CssR n=1 Tax=Thomasclavelia cocleata TaxID=69824 RepID=A0A1I0C742_9FIRM|nr:response regulator transcription factor [Thomasclavelia cocleata]MCR1959624.1 response regulator transcription factor [Thomasclavelia cocleata]NDO42247.1 response regulator transcription factor [Thomasclavelia cocleata]PJN80106.1 DNA-binding response regulator [Thomasclavelia cocleata]SET15157.1 two-component system, OmpR family, response regulator CssR [Thomasclavelia cocleata]
MQFKINIIDDEKNLNDLVRTYLEKEGYIVYSFYTYDEALMHKSDDVHLWLIDIMLDRSSGFELFNEIKSARPKMPIIFMSARDQEFDRIIGLEKGSDDYITKPFNIKEVVLRINNLIKRSYDDPSKIKMDGYNIDLEKRRVFCQDEEIVLTTKEYDLLVYFIVNKGLAISREQVLNKVWDENYFGSDRVVDDTLRRLRKKMPEINVRTIYGFGYRLD